MKTQIRKVKQGDIIEMTPRTTLRSETTTLKVNKLDKICGKQIEILKVNKSSLKINFEGQTYRIPFTVNPSVEIVEINQN